MKIYKITSKYGRVSYAPHIPNKEEVRYEEIELNEENICLILNTILQDIKSCVSPNY